MRLFFSLFCLLPFTLVWVPSVQSQERATKKNPQLSEQPLTVAPEQLSASTQGPQLTLSPDSGYAGQTVTLTGSGYTRGTYSIHWDGKIGRSQDITPTRRGEFSAKFTIPSDVSLGEHTISVADKLGRGDDATFKVKPQVNVSTRSGGTRKVDPRERPNYPKGWIIITSISASAAMAGITLGVRRAIKTNRRKRWQENAKKEEPPKTCQHCTRYCHKVEIEAEHARRMITQISYEVYNPVSEEKRQKVRSKGKALSRLNKALSNHCHGKNPKKQQRLLENVSYMLLWQLKKRLRTEPVPCNVSFTGHLEGGRSPLSLHFTIVSVRVL